MDSARYRSYEQIMKISLNGKIKELPKAVTLKEFIGHFTNNKSPLVAEVNGEIVRTPQWEETLLQDGDAIELVSFVGGG